MKHTVIGIQALSVILEVVSDTGIQKDINLKNC